MKTEPVKLRCRSCQKIKFADEFGWSNKRNRPTRTCVSCWVVRSDQQRSAATDELANYYAEIRSLMVTINEERAAAAQTGEPLSEREVQSLGDIFLGVLTEDVYRDIVEALSRKAKTGDVNATKLLLEERARILGDTSKADVDESFASLFNIDPLSIGLDSE